jgi:hypothetical protein
MPTVRCRSDRHAAETFAALERGSRKLDQPVVECLLGP